MSCAICLRAYVAGASVRRKLGIDGDDQEEEADSDGGNEGDHGADFEQETERASCYNVVPRAAVKGVRLYVTGTQGWTWSITYSIEDSTRRPPSLAGPGPCK